MLNAFHDKQQLQMHLMCQSLTLSPGVLSVANTEDEIFLGQGNVLELENNPFSFNQDYDKCFSCESGDRYRAFHKENCPFFLSRFLCESVQVTQGRERREAI